MNVHISYKAPKTPDCEREFSHHLEKLARRLQVFRPELVHLHGSLEGGSGREGFVVSLNLRLPSGQIAAREAASEAVPCIKAAFNHLLEEVTKHKERLRGHYRANTRRRHHPGLQQAKPTGPLRPPAHTPFNETFAAVKPAEVSAVDIRQYVNANLARLERYVDRELQYRRNNGTLTPDAVTREEVVDEVVVAALGEENGKPQVLGLEPWLYRLALRAIDQIAAGNSEKVETVSWEQPARGVNVRGSDESFLQYHQPDEVITRREITADRRLSTPEQIAASDEMIDQVEGALRDAKREERDAFILYAVEGFTPEDIAAISDRKLDDVNRSLASARAHVRKRVAVAGDLKSRLLHDSKSA